MQSYLYTSTDHILSRVQDSWGLVWQHWWSNGILQMSNWRTSSSSFKSGVPSRCSSCLAFELAGGVLSCCAGFVAPVVGLKAPSSSQYSQIPSSAMLSKI